MLAFGILWILLIGIVTILVVNDSDLKSAIMLLPFWAFGIKLLYSGIKNAMNNSATNEKGSYSYGVVVGFSRTGVYINRNPMWNAHVLAIVEHGIVREFQEGVGMNPELVVGDFVSVKYHEDDINILGRISLYEIPERERSILQSATHIGFPQTRDYIVE